MVTGRWPAVPPSPCGRGPTDERTPIFRSCPIKLVSAEGRPSPHPSVVAQGDSPMRVEAEFPRLAPISPWRWAGLEPAIHAELSFPVPLPIGAHSTRGRLILAKMKPTPPDLYVRNETGSVRPGVDGYELQVRFYGHLQSPLGGGLGAASGHAG